VTRAARVSGTNCQGAVRVGIKRRCSRLFRGRHIRQGWRQSDLSRKTGRCRREPLSGQYQQERPRQPNDLPDTRCPPDARLLNGLYQMMRPSASSLSEKSFGRPRVRWRTGWTRVYATADLKYYLLPLFSRGFGRVGCVRKRSPSANPPRGRAYIRFAARKSGVFAVGLFILGVRFCYSLCGPSPAACPRRVQRIFDGRHLWPTVCPIPARRTGAP
jgi:hypothetical protein